MFCILCNIIDKFCGVCMGQKGRNSAITCRSHGSLKPGSILFINSILSCQFWKFLCNADNKEFSRPCLSASARGSCHSLSCLEAGVCWSLGTKGGLVSLTWGAGSLPFHSHLSGPTGLVFHGDYIGVLRREVAGMA